MPVYLLGTLDTKGHEIAFVRDLLHEYGAKTCVVDTGCLGSPLIAADVTSEQVFAAAGASLEMLREKNDRGQAITQAAIGAASIVSAAQARGEVDGILALGGSAGTTIGTSAMRALPLGVPKLMVSTLASGQTRPYVGGKDILMLNAVVDIAGINRISRLVLTEAARAMAGMVLLSRETSAKSQEPNRDDAASKTSGSRLSPLDSPPSTDKPLVAATMFGVTTPCVELARKILEAAGYEVLVFHATGNGGEAMEGLIADGLIAGVLDITTTELADELVGGTLTAGPTRLTAAGKRGVPQVISVGALDMVNFGPPNTVPDKFQQRQFYQHNPTVTLMRTTPDENRRLGEEIGRKAAAATGPTSILIPLRGVSAIDQIGKPFDDPAARQALYDGIRSTHGTTELIELDHHINAPEFAEAAANKLLSLMRGQ
ncbi:MAG: Tm-1-like ATP-binding domain-containing protein [Planctomycetota bacterium]